MSKLRAFLVNVIGRDKPNPRLQFRDEQAGPTPEEPGGEANRQVLDAPDDDLVDFTCRIVVVNKTDVALSKGDDKVEQGRYQIRPPRIVPARQAIAFTVMHNVMVIGNMTWIPDGALGEQWKLGYKMSAPRGITTQRAEVRSELNNKDRFTDAREDNSRNSELRFILIQKGPAPPPQSFVSRVVIVNDTDLVLSQSFEGLSAGVFETAPHKTIPARQAIEFEVRSQGTRTQDQQQFVSGALDWTAGGQKGPEAWSLKYAAATGLPSTADSDVRSDRLIADKPMIDGTNFRFTLRDKNDPPPPRPESFVSHVVIFNNTTVVLHRISDAPVAGTYEAKPRDTVPPGKHMEFTIRSEARTDGGPSREVAAGNSVWRPEGAADGEEWLIQHVESPEGKDEFSSSTIQSQRFVAARPVLQRVYFFKLTETSRPQQPPPPPPRPNEFVSRVVVVNNTDVALGQKDVSVIGTFVQKPPPTIAAGATAGFSVKSETDLNDGTEIAGAAVVWEPEGIPSGESWTISFDRSSNDTDGRAQQDLKSIRFAADPPESEGTDFRFTLNQAPEPEFKEPVRTRQPTLRLHDKGVDGWVEYLQEQLNALLVPSPNLKVDGHFGPATHKAVFAFQRQEGIQRDGVVGNQTWAALRHGPREEPSTDKRPPHTFKEQGLEARWLREDTTATFSQGKDELVLICVSVGDETNLEGQNVNVFATPPGAKRKGVVAKIGERIEKSKTGQGDNFRITLANFRKTFPSVPETAPVQDYVVEAYFDEELGSDFYTSTKGGILVIE